MTTVGQRIREHRQARGLTQKQLARPEFTKAFISLIECGRSRPSIHTLSVLARRLGTSIDALLGLEGQLPDAAAQSLLALSREAIDRRDLTSALKYLDTVDHLISKHDLGKLLPEHHLQRAELFFKHSKFPEAFAQAERARDAADREKDPLRLGRSLMFMGSAKQRAHEHAVAIPLYEEALKAFGRARAGRDRAKVQTQIHLASCLGWVDRLHEARRKYREAAQSSPARRDAALRGQALWGLGWIERKAGNLGEARMVLLQAKAALEKVEDLPNLMRVLHNLGQVEFEGARARDAIRYFERALAIAERLGQSMDRAATLTELSRARLFLGEVDQAERLAHEAITEAGRAGDAVEVADAQVVLARIRMLQGDAKSAAGLLKQGAAAYQSRGLLRRVTETARELGLLLKDQGRLSDAAEILALAVS